MKIQEYTLIIFGMIYFISIINYSIKLRLLSYQEFDELLRKALEENPRLLNQFYE